MAKPSRPVSVIVSDLDRFKRINDNYGHLQGDKVLQFVANLLMDSVRPQDIAARIGGEEFVRCWPTPLQMQPTRWRNAFG